jgi:zinc/manganese transport system substrate-binding protein
MKLYLYVIYSVLIISGFCLSSLAAPIRIVAALPDLASIASYIGGDQVTVSSIAKANSNPHSIEVFPSYMAKVSGASIYLKCGLGLDQWSDAIIDGSRNGKILVIDCSNGVAVLEKPTGKVDASLGDVHPFGNPHYWINPENGVIIAKNIVAGLQKIDPKNAEVYSARADQFGKECHYKMVIWKEKLKPVYGTGIVTYHSSWVYFADAFGFTIDAKVEPFPGIPPTGNHLADLVTIIRRENIRFLLQEPYFSDDAPRFLHRQTSIVIIKCAPSCSDTKPTSYFKHFDLLINQFAQQGGK